MRKAALYLRVSTDRQTTDNQMLELQRYAQAQGWQVVRVYSDTFTGTTADREQYQQMLADAQAGMFDTLLFWSISRITRQGSEAVYEFKSIMDKAGIDFFSLTETALQTEDKMVRNVYLTLLAEMARKERDDLSLRTKAGLARVKAQGIKVGRPAKQYNMARAKALRAQGFSLRVIAGEMGVATSTLCQALR